MQVSIVVLSLGKRHAEAVTLQGVLTQWGCIIRTRLGIHGAVGSSCSDRGLIILEVVSTAAQKAKFLKDLRRVPALKVKSVDL